MSATTAVQAAVRPISQVVQGQKMMEGAGVRICRTIGTGPLRNLDPYLMLDELKLPAEDAFAGFPDHPVSAASEYVRDRGGLLAGARRLT